MTKDADDLLQAEQAVQEVLKELEALKRQVGGYETAKNSLEGVRQALESLISKTSAIAEQAHLATATLTKIGTPELLSRIESLKAVTDNLAAQIPKHAERIRSLALAGLIASAVSLVGVAAILVKLFFM